MAVVDVCGAVGAAHGVQRHRALDASARVELLLTLLQLHGVHLACSSQSGERIANSQS